MKLLTTLNREDALQVLELYRKFLAESRYALEDFDANSIWHLLEQTLLQPSKFFIAYLKVDKKVIGFLVGSISKRHFTTTQYGMDLGQYVVKDFRGQGLSKQLTKAYEAWVKNCGVTLVYLGLSSGIETERAAKLYKKFGYALVSQAFEKEIL